MPKPAQVLVDLELVEKGEMPAAEWVETYGRTLVEMAIGDSLKVARAERVLTVVVGIMGDLNGAMQSFKRATGWRSDRRVGATAKRWACAAGLASVVEAILLRFYGTATAQQPAAGQPAAVERPGSAPAAVSPKRGQAAQHLADLLAEARGRGVEGPELERFERAVSQLRKTLLGDQALEDHEPADGGQEN